MYKPYPKWIETPEKGRFIVKTLAEHQQYPDAVPLAEGMQVNQEDIEEITREKLLAQAEEFGVKIDKRWSYARIKQALDDAR